MNVELKDAFILASLLIAALTLVSNTKHRRDAATKEMVEDMEERQLKYSDKVRMDLELRVSAAEAKRAELEARLAKLQLEFVQHQGHAITRSEMGDILDAALAPLLRHVAKSETFMEELLRAGLLSTHHNPRGDTR